MWKWKFLVMMAADFIEKWCRIYFEKIFSQELLENFTHEFSMKF